MALPTETDRARDEGFTSGQTTGARRSQPSDPAGTPGAPRARDSLPAALVLAGTRLGLGAVLVVLAVHFAGPSTAPMVGRAGSFSGALLHWDSTWYHAIVQSGYPLSHPQRTAFFPLYPLVVRGAMTLGLSFAVATLTVSWLGLFVATWAVIDLSGHLFPGRPSYRAGALLVWFPTSVFLTAGYAESVYLGLAGWSFSMVARRRYAAAAALAGLASAARPEGLVVGLVVVTALLLERRYRPAAGAVVVSGSGLATFSAFCWLRFGDPFEYLKVQSHWHRQTTFPLVAPARALYAVIRGWVPYGGYSAELIIQAVLVVALLAGLVWFTRVALARRADLRAYIPFLVACLALASSNGRYGVLPDGSGRMVLAMTPVLALAGTARWWRIAAGLGIAAAVILQVLFASGQMII